MAFSPTLKICQPNCSTLSFTDITNVYSEGNTAGWGAGNSVLGSSVTSATIVVTDSTGTTVFTYTTTDQIPDAVTGEIIFTDYTSSLVDGTYSVTYTLIVGGDMYVQSQTILFSCNFECCITKQLAKVAKSLCGDSCDTSAIDEFLLVEGMLYAYKAAAMCEKASIKLEIETMLQRFCDYQCNC
jgi:hypothetical protein